MITVSVSLIQISTCSVSGLKTKPRQWLNGLLKMFVIWAWLLRWQHDDVVTLFFEDVWLMVNIVKVCPSGVSFLFKFDSNFKTNGQFTIYQYLCKVIFRWSDQPLTHPKMSFECMQYVILSVQYFESYSIINHTYLSSLSSLLVIVSTDSIANRLIIGSSPMTLHLISVISCTELLLEGRTAYFYGA